MHSKQFVKIAMFIQLGLLLLLFCGVGNVHCSTVHENRIDLQSLLEFKKGITEDPNRALLSWNTSTHFCRWNGVICTTTRPWRVSGLNLTARSLAGEITSSLANLTSLTILDLSANRFFGRFPLLNHLQQLDILYMNDNSLDGVIPDTLTNCSKLRQIHLFNNQLRGVIPPKIGYLTNLEVLNLANNSLSGIIPATVGNITKLRYLNLGINNLTGIIPATIGYLTHLSFLRLKYNQLEGKIPDGIWQLSNLTMLLLGQNRLSGGIPQELNLPLLQLLSLEQNMLSQVLPPNIGYALRSLQQISLFSNKFEGRIPISIGNASDLQLIELSSNNFSGQIPTSIGRLSKLSRLILEKNQLESTDDQGWEFLHELRNCSSLTVLSLSGNNLQGSLPHSVGDLSKNLTYLILSENNISGIVPPSVGNLPNLIKLSLGNNSFSGEIGEWIGNLNNLQVLSLGDNNLVGPIPPSIGNITHLTELGLNRNNFEGSIPPSLGYLSQLAKLDISYNKLQGNIPQEIGNLQNLNQLYLSANNITGVIPDTLGRCQHLAAIQMDQNVLTGGIPVTLGNILSLNWLNLSHNNLLGTIPAALNGLPVLTVLDLSYNDLRGEIPRSFMFQNATVLLEGNDGLCGGAMNLHLPSCPVHSHRTVGRANLIKILIPIFGFMSLLLLVYFLLERKAKRTYLSSDYIGENFPKVSYSDLAQATTNFSTSKLIGRGSYGSVYRGKLKESKTDVAVKVFDLEMRGAERSFMSECEALRSIQHRNLLPIITACSTVDNEGNVFKALVYEFMPNGSLDIWLHHKGDLKSPKQLGLTQRISIAVNIADALDYLHHDCGRSIIHRDLKPSNILLNDDMTAFLGDFGIARFYDSCSQPTSSVSSVGVNGTIGYIAPEFAGGGHASTSGDAYSFGIVLLEMMTGKRPTDPMFKDDLDIVAFVKRNVPHQIHNVIDAHIIEECKELAEGKKVSEHAVFQSIVSPALEVALSCTRTLPSERTNMKQTASKMHAIETSCLGWRTKKNTD